MDPDLALVEGLRRREMDSLQQAYERHGTWVQHLCRRFLGRGSDAEDAAQDVFVKLYERAGSFDGRSRFSTWLHRLTVNLCLHRLERERLRAARALPSDEDAPLDSGAGPSDALARVEANAQLEQLLGRLSPEHRAVVVLRELEQLSYREIALALDLPEGTVMSRLSRAREQLVRFVEPMRPEPCPPTPTTCQRPR
jgi:RNA polymerase sigma-70 factor (ECF subfamily)